MHAESVIVDLPPQPPAPRLLVADDSPVERLALAHFLRRSGYQVAEAGDGKSALEHLKETEVDLLLLDLNMPQGDGFDVLRYLQEHRRSLPVILLSGMPATKSSTKCTNSPSTNSRPCSSNQSCLNS